MKSAPLQWDVKKRITENRPRNPICIPIYMLYVYSSEEHTDWARAEGREPKKKKLS